MEIVEGEVMKKKSKLLSMEDYLDFFDGRNNLNLTRRHLLQIIGMHSFKRNIKAKKSDLIDMVSAMELMDLCRSTLLDDSISGGTGMTLKEVIDDLEHLDWKECHVTSLHILGVEASSSSTATSYESASAMRKHSKKRNMKKLNKIGVDTSPGTIAAAGSATQSLNF